MFVVLVFKIGFNILLERQEENKDEDLGLICWEKNEKCEEF